MFKTGRVEPPVAVAHVEFHQYSPIHKHQVCLTSIVNKGLISQQGSVLLCSLENGLSYPNYIEYLKTYSTSNCETTERYPDFLLTMFDLVPSPSSLLLIKIYILNFSYSSFKRTIIVKLFIYSEDLSINIVRLYDQISYPGNLTMESFSNIFLNQVFMMSFRQNVLSMYETVQH